MESGEGTSEYKSILEMPTVASVEKRVRMIGPQEIQVADKRRGNYNWANRSYVSAFNVH